MEALALLYARFLVAGSPFRGRGGLLGVRLEVGRGLGCRYGAAVLVNGVKLCSSLRREVRGGNEAQAQIRVR